jgi:hypothetical protein
MLDAFAPIKDRTILNRIKRKWVDIANPSMFAWNININEIAPIREEITKMKKASEYEETRKTEDKMQKETCAHEVLGDPVQCMEAWDNRMSEELRRIRPILEALMCTQYPNPFMKWIEAFKIEAENFNPIFPLTQIGHFDILSALFPARR